MDQYLPRSLLRVLAASSHAVDLPVNLHLGTSGEGFAPGQDNRIANQYLSLQAVPRIMASVGLGPAQSSSFDIFFRRLMRAINQFLLSSFMSLPFMPSNLFNSALRFSAVAAFCFSK